VKNAATGVAVPRKATAAVSMRVGGRDETYAPKIPKSTNATIA
jgi:hypothetical protein